MLFRLGDHLWYHQRRYEVRIIYPIADNNIEYGLQRMLDSGFLRKYLIIVSEDDLISENISWIIKHHAI